MLKDLAEKMDQCINRLEVYAERWKLFFKNQMEMLEMENTISDKKNFFDRFFSKLNTAERKKLVSLNL